VQSDCHEDEVEMGEILDQLPVLCEHMFTDFGRVQPWEEGVSSFEIVTVHIDKAKETINEFFEYIIRLPGDVVLRLRIFSSLQGSSPKPKEVLTSEHHPQLFTMADSPALICVDNLAHDEEIYGKSNAIRVVPPDKFQSCCREETCHCVIVLSIQLLNITVVQWMATYLGECKVPHVRIYGKVTAKDKCSCSGKKIVSHCFQSMF
jgi:hypothetical protein